MKKLILIGGGGHCHSVIDVVEAQKEYEIAGILDASRLTSSVLNYKVLGGDELINSLVHENCYFMITVGNVGKINARYKLIELLDKRNAKLATIVSPLAYVSKSATVNPGTVIHHHALVNSKAVVGRHCILNTKCLVEHDALLGENAHVSTGAIINGDCKIGDNCFIGSQATLKQSVQLTSSCIVGAGSVVINDLNVSGTYTGVPAQLWGKA